MLPFLLGLGALLVAALAWLCRGPREAARGEFEERCEAACKWCEWHAWAVSQGYVSVTPMRLGEDDPTQMDTWRAIFKQ